MAGKSADFLSETRETSLGCHSYWTVDSDLMFRISKLLRACFSSELIFR